jgi:tyrosyl-tRNA synthetase
VNDALVADEAAALSDADFVDGAIKLSLGKKNHALLKLG